MKKLKTKKGMTLSNVPFEVMMLVIVGMLAGVGYLALNKFGLSEWFITNFSIVMLIVITVVIGRLYMKESVTTQDR